MPPDAALPPDGRHARRERSRVAVIDAVFALVRDGKVPPSVDQVAERAGVSVSSIFRNFDGLDDMQRQAFDRFQDRFAHLLDAPDAPHEGEVGDLADTDTDIVDDAADTADSPDTADSGVSGDSVGVVPSGRAERIAGLVRSRVRFYDAAGPLLHIARQRALDHRPMADAVARSRVRLAGQAQRCLAPETAALTPAEAANLLALVDAATSPEAFEVMGAAHGRTQRQISRSWTRAVTALVDAWCTDPTTGERTRQHTGEHTGQHIDGHPIQEEPT